MSAKSIVAGIAILAVLGGAVAGLAWMLHYKQGKAADDQFYLAEQFYDKNSFPEAEKAYLELLEKYPRSHRTEETIRKLGLIFQKTETFDRAKQYWARYLGEYPAGRYVAEAYYQSGYAMEKLGDKEGAREAYEKTIQLGGGGNEEFLARCGRARMTESDGKLLEALKEYKVIYGSAPRDGQAFKTAKSLLGNLNVKLINSNVKTDDSQLYTVQKGDTVTSIGSHFNVARAVILKANNLGSSGELRLNKALKITPNKFRVLIKLADFTLTLYNGDEFFKEYAVGLGRNDTTIPGKYVIRDKVENPTWFGPKGVIPPLDPQNELGTRWMGLEPEEPGLPSDLGIHTTIDPSSIGWASSSGCPRLRKEDGEELFDLLTLNTPVEIVK